jgi:thioredoxin-like negative regulator of GroEL
MDMVKSENPDVIFENVDVDQQRPLATSLNVTSIPTVIILKDNNEVYRFTGIRTKNEINSIIKQFK